MSTSRGRMKAGDEDARRLLGDGVVGESESEISSMCVHPFLGVCCEADPRGFGLVVLRKISSDPVLTTGSFRPVNLNGEGSGASLCVNVLRGRPVGRFGDAEVFLSCNMTFRTGDFCAGLSVKEVLRGLPRARAGDVCADGSSEASLRGRPRPRAGEVCVGLSSRGSLRGRPRPRLGEATICTSSFGSPASACLRGPSRSVAGVVVEKGRTCVRRFGLTKRSGPASSILASNACSAVLLADEVAE